MTLLHEYQGSCSSQEVLLWISYIASRYSNISSMYQLLPTILSAFGSFEHVAVFDTSFSSLLKLFVAFLLGYNLVKFMQVLPLPNIPFFWFLFRSYSHWRALKVRQFLEFIFLLHVSCWITRVGQHEVVRSTQQHLLQIIFPGV